VVIGAAAFPVHGYSRITFDIDIFIQATEHNAKRTLQALHKTGSDVSDLSVSVFLQKRFSFGSTLLKQIFIRP
jgi:hypothetical protein